jgi:cytochrome b561
MTKLRPGDDRVEVYSGRARTFHWLTVALVLVQVPLGLAMVYRGKWLDLFDAVTNTMYSSHKLLGMIILIVVVARLLYRFAHGAPADEPTLATWQKVISHLNHWGLYLMLIVVPLLGWLGVSYYGALDIFGLFSLPALASQDQAQADAILGLHLLAAIALVLLVGLHVAAALYHYFIRGDNVLGRMWPALLRRR